ncbi:MAG: hypothetical protein JHC26_05620 [Thermofilum sp.]|jgi:hypothetical protein|uniref:hypothetical protein n=1 Tax=Thermofilum sp. TaxID=1961369 RepID=UPI002588F4DA|nr:hypothetical protein [Thermofilum sp.]MCI4408550.1 hypothetical protein [Thermofilum sp.]
MFEVLGVVMAFMGFAVMGYFWTSNKDMLILFGAVFGAVGIALVLLGIYLRLRGEKTGYNKSSKRIGRWNI